MLYSCERVAPPVLVQKVGKVNDIKTYLEILDVVAPLETELVVDVEVKTVFPLLVSCITLVELTTVILEVVFVGEPLLEVLCLLLC